MNRAKSSLLVFALCALTAHGQLAPDEALKSFQTADDLRIELVAAEPLVASPCALSFDEKGRLFVAENRGYPSTAEPPQGMITLLEDTDGDGRMDKRTVFAEGLTYPNGVLPWNGGVIVTCAPDVLFLKDTDGDGRADVRRVLLTGFDASKSTQLRVNAPTLGPDGWIYFAAGLVGGSITSPEHSEKPALKMTGDLRWNPRTGDFENVDGRSQYGQSFDDFGRRFICMNRLPVQHVVLSAKTLARNPFLGFSDTVQDCSERTVKTGLKGGGDGVKLFPISSNITTADSHAGSFSAACGIQIWRGGALPDRYRGAALSCDPTGNLVHVDRLLPHGATFSALPLLEGRELLASRDDWFRPVFLGTGPDGALYVCDMYRQVIEHPDYLPAEVRKHTDFESGKTMGRIWRIVGAGSEAKRVLPPDKEAATLLPLLSSGRAWDRTTAFRLLVENPPTAALPAIAAAYHSGVDAVGSATLLQFATTLRAMAGESGGPKVDSKAVDQLLREGLGHTLPEVREVALALLAPKVNWDQDYERMEWWWALSTDPDPRVRFQFAISADLSENIEAFLPMLDVANRGAADRWTRAAVLSTPPFAPHYFSMAGVLLNQKSPWSDDQAILLSEVARIDGASSRGKIELMEPKSLCKLVGEKDVARAVAMASGYLTGSEQNLRQPGEAGKSLLRKAGAILADTKTSPVIGRFAITLLARGEWEMAKGPLFQAAETNPALRADVTRALVSFDDPMVGPTLLSAQRWKSMTPVEREMTLAALLARPVHISRVLDLIESGTLPRNALSAAQKTALSKNKDATVRERAARLLGAPADVDRMKAYEAAKAALALTPKADHGRELFKAICSTCHRLDREGYAVGPDLLDIRNQPKESILLHIVVPNFEIAPAFAATNVELKDGRTLLGIVASETPESITLRQPLGVEENILRSNIATTTANEHSLMPPGLESAMSPQDLADLLAFLKGEK